MLAAARRTLLCDRPRLRLLSDQSCDAHSHVRFGSGATETGQALTGLPRFAHPCRRRKRCTARGTQFLCQKVLRQIFAPDHQGWRWAQFASGSPGYQNSDTWQSVDACSRIGATMTVDESKALKKDARVYWRGNAADSGIVTETSWDAVTIAWNNGKVARVHHGDMREIRKTPTTPHTG
jgi:hypothetical protein